MEIPETSLDKLTAALKALGVQAPSLLTKVGMLRSLINEIETAKKDGYSYGLILETLMNNGFKKTTLNQFYGLMNRLRLERGVVPVASVLLRRSGDRDETENKTTETLEPQTQSIDSATPSNPATQEELKRIARGTIDPNQFLDD